ncbi:hypothetical protein FNW52_03615 [Flavobacterium sp. ZT3R18]|uniref:hypothetical protein n=1 Tax=Flavobacterium sp. ZT3R18 TaxID=2594429 RepID=UPI00117B89BF|nr:hypothetical protein [Flavobacterium sp. ZT3R18]TRX37999.1 hypothetical protein FNW52_03615 [Flavobacterium sp. ZT3R18]
MKNFTIRLQLLSIILLLTACSPLYLVGKNDFQQIPKGSKKVIVNVSYATDSLFKIVSKNFAREGCPVQTDKNAMQIYCNGKSVEGGTLLKAMAFVEPTATGSQVIFSGEWGLNQEGQIMMQAATNIQYNATSPIVFEKNGTSKTDVAFQYLVLFARQIENGNISYSN